MEALSLIFLDPMMGILKIPSDILEETGEYLQVIFMGLMFTFVYNYFAALLRALGNSVVPLLYLAVSALGNNVMDLVFIQKFHM